MTDAPRIAVLGPAASDEIILADGSHEFRPGGVPLYAARALRFAGATPIVIETGAMRSRLRHTAAGTEQEIVSTAHSLDAEAAARLVPRIAGCAWLQLGAQTAGDFSAAAITALAGSGARIMLDGQGLSRGADPGPVRAHPIDQADLAGVHALHLNHAEAEAAGPLDVEELLVSRSQRGVDVVAGGRRTLVAGGGGSFADPTGAGDSLCALYCLARARGAEPADAARWAQREVERLYGS